MSESIVGIPPPDRRPARPPTTTSLEVVAETLASLRQSLGNHCEIWLIAAIFFTGTNVVDILFTTPGHPFQSPLSIFSLIVRLLSYVWVVVAAIRAFAGQSAVWTINLPLLRTVAAFVALTVSSMLLLFVFTAWISRPLIGLMTADPQSHRFAALIVLCIWLIGFAVATVRLSPWIVALAINDRSIGLKTAWKGMRGATLAAIGALIWTAPVPIAHVALTAEAQYLTGTSQLVFTVIDGLISVLLVLISMAIAAALYQFVAKYKSLHFPA